MSKKNKSSKKVEIVTELQYPGGITVRTFGKGKMKGQNISVTQEPANIFGPNVTKRMLAVKGKTETLIEKSLDGYRAI